MVLVLRSYRSNSHIYIYIQDANSRGARPGNGISHVLILDIIKARNKERIPGNSFVDVKLLRKKLT
jgi:hypothetical protein